MYLPTYLSTYFIKDHYFGRNETFKDLKHGCMHEQAVLMKQLSGSYLLKTVEKNWDCYRHFQKCMHKLTAKTMRGKAQDSDRGISGISTNHKWSITV